MRRAWIFCVKIQYFFWSGWDLNRGERVAREWVGGSERPCTRADHSICHVFKEKFPLNLQHTHTQSDNLNLAHNLAGVTYLLSHSCVCDATRNQLSMTYIHGIWIVKNFSWNMAIFASGFVCSYVTRRQWRCPQPSWLYVAAMNHLNVLSLFGTLLKTRFVKPFGKHLRRRQIQKFVKSHKETGYWSNTLTKWRRNRLVVEHFQRSHFITTFAQN